ncbi:HXXEE domain-containing protein [Pseudochrobactrum kiredjianiae]|uniref:HXXEE domain-containing protein n=1 Tax=Pseudochrobactrum kiredjianiae TaxID=386305 RepID=A0ABW3V9Y3_9HYPH|nr:HXXEE domain-containing protein [Pseudochrobactrum kiredjianiae]MDM7851275.1 HXXEE domain-containing protein [Pseudochrobactrum kiredjianiae]
MKQTKSSLQILWGVAFIAFALHNFEELWCGLPYWSARQSSSTWMAAIMPPQRFVVSIAILTVLIMLIAVVSIWLSEKSSIIILRIFAWTMMLNATSHVIISGLTQSLMPGVVTAVCILFPVMALIILQIRHRQSGNL